MNENKRNRGITLIALIVTIIVLLILAGITIASLTGENGILTRAKSAKTVNEKAEAEERIKIALSDWKIGKYEGMDFEAYLGQKKTNKEIDDWGHPNGMYEVKVNGYVATVDDDGNIIGEVKVAEDKPASPSREGLNIGDYINFEPTTAATSYSKDKLAAAITGSSRNSSDLTKDTLSWQILRIYDDGRMDLIGSSTTKNVFFSGSVGYNNGVYVMNDICKELYSRPSDGIEARSVNYEDDIEPWLTDAGKTVRDNYIANQINTVNSDTSYSSNRVSVDTENKTVTWVKNYSYYPVLYAEENNSGINTTVLKTDGIKPNNPFYTASNLITTNGLNSSYKQADNLTTKQTYWFGSMDTSNFGDGYNALKTNSISYWVASRCVDCRPGYADFDFHRVGECEFSGYGMYRSTNYADYIGEPLRPVVSLGSDVQISPCTGTNRSDNPHTISSYK